MWMKIIGKILGRVAGRMKSAVSPDPDTGAGPSGDPMPTGSTTTGAPPAMGGQMDLQGMQNKSRMNALMALK